MRRMSVVVALAVSAMAVAANADAGDASRVEGLVLRGQPQKLHVYGSRGQRVAIVTSGDGGWVHLGPDVALFLAAQGFFVVGFDAKAYLSSFTSGSTTLAATDVPADYAALVDWAAQGGRDAPLLFGVSEGAGLSVLAATSPEMQRRIGGVVALGLPDRNELGWRWRDQVIYITKKTPNEPLFSVVECVPKVAPVPLVIVRSTGDEFVPAAETERIVAAAREPKRLFTLTAADHRFSDKQAELQGVLKEAIAWTAQVKPGSR